MMYKEDCMHKYELDCIMLKVNLGQTTFGRL